MTVNVSLRLDFRNHDKSHALQLRSSDQEIEPKPALRTEGLILALKTNGSAAASDYPSLNKDTNKFCRERKITSESLCDPACPERLPASFGHQPQLINDSGYSTRSHNRRVDQMQKEPLLLLSPAAVVFSSPINELIAAGAKD